jgi:hypothetical protein
VKRESHHEQVQVGHGNYQLALHASTRTEEIVQLTQSTLPHLMVSAKKLQPAGFPALVFQLQHGLQLGQSLVNERIVDITVVHLGDRPLGLFRVVVVETVSRALWEEHCPTAEDETEDELETDGDPPACGTVDTVGDPVETISPHDAAESDKGNVSNRNQKPLKICVWSLPDGDHDLVQHDKRSSQISRSCLSVVQWYEGRQRSDPKSSDEPTDGDLCDTAHRSGLDDTSDGLFPHQRTSSV